MLIQDWLNILLALVGLPSSFILIQLAKQRKGLIELYFGLALISCIVGRTLIYIPNTNFNPDVTEEWGNLISITLILCGLFVRIRHSKPIFARFPQPLTALPFIILLFYPLVDDAYVIKDILMMIFQAGAIIVALLMASINHYQHKDRLYILIGVALFLLSFILYWILSTADVDPFMITSQIALSVGIIVSTLGFKRLQITEYNY
jgi:hypothetical protein